MIPELEKLLDVLRLIYYVLSYGNLRKIKKALLQSFFS
jgi:hypothetical protein